MKINELASKLGISTRTIRFYEQHGLLPGVKREQNAYRVFDEQDVWRLQTIIALREAGMAVKEIREVLDVEQMPDHERLRYVLELQQALLTGQWLEMRRMAETTSQMLDLLRAEQDVPVQEFFEMAQQARQLRELRQNWRDHWNFDQRAVEHDVYVQTDSQQYPGYDVALSHTASTVRATAGEHGLDLGTGTGNLAGTLLAYGAHMSGIDQSREMLKQCRSKFPQMDVRIGNLLSIPYADDSFDFAVSSFTFRHLTESQLPLALEELHRVLQKHGRICITDRESEQEVTLDQAQTDGMDAKAEYRIANEQHFKLSDVLYNWLEQHDYMVQRTSPYPAVFTLLAVPIHSRA
ncbi:MerR family transcriptional regulator [Paenibacillus sp. WLX1005]|uniref:MerR family transcriptional regulator n=1 Tax=Paenibacillus sp. WLX1005 TaxID=3243766 RepID=UPI0039842942